MNYYCPKCTSEIEEGDIFVWDGKAVDAYCSTCGTWAPVNYKNRQGMLFR